MILNYIIIHIKILLYNITYWIITNTLHCIMNIIMKCIYIRQPQIERQCDQITTYNCNSNVHMHDKRKPCIRHSGNTSRTTAECQNWCNIVTKTQTRITTKLLDCLRESWSLCARLDQTDARMSCCVDEHTVDTEPASSCSEHGTLPCMPHTGKPMQIFKYNVITKTLV